MSDMSDFEQWYFLNQFPQSTANEYEIAKDAWESAIASMQDEALQLPEGDREAIEAFMLDHFSDKTFRHYIRATLAGDFAYQLANALRKLYTHAPDSAARIAEQSAEIARLTKELEEARKQLKYCADDYAYIPTQILDCTEGLTKWIRGRSEVLQAAISKIGGGE